MEKGLHVLSNASTTAFTLPFFWGFFLAGLLFLHVLAMPLLFLLICIYFPFSVWKSAVQLIR